eukprot:CAMPEP_0116825024 /NCGR_PEP_ID=MMETSP0418-20121206/1729_1 /TAXON_ID=1158023 /ORGANISM="Astrosyne radiata, Strain 13vi08-1A" /LENGTH=58 /DNA_ID=CAMNT_0004453473 /DNA_START=132 /DNA_END=305 /DNA_ORIENTATION=+
MKDNEDWMGRPQQSDSANFTRFPLSATLVDDCRYFYPESRPTVWPPEYDLLLAPCSLL